MIDWRDLQRVATHERSLTGDEAQRRRSISCLYYALFHRLCDASSRLFAQPGSPLDLKLRRSFEHQAMSAVCKAYVDAFRIGRFRPELSWLTASKPSPSLAAVAGTFIELQEHRKIADYDFASDVSEVDHSRLLAAAEHAHWQPDELQGLEELTNFLAVLFLKERWSRRG